MPYHVAKSSSCPTSRPFGVIKDSDGKVMGCHPTEAAAQRQLAALYAQEKNAMTDLRNLPDSVRERLTEGGFLDERHRGFDIDLKGRAVEERATPRRLEVRLAEDGSPTIAGYASIYDYDYDVAGGPPFGWSERIAVGAATKSIAERDNVYLFFDHDGLPLATTKDGSLTLESDKIGLYTEASVDATSPYSMEVVRRIQSGALDAMSFAFKTVRQEWDDAYEDRTITELKLFDVSVVAFPANPATVVQMRGHATVGMTLADALAMGDELRSHSRQ